MEHEEKLLKTARNLSGLLLSGKDPYPLIVEIRPTDICNHSCGYCVSGGSMPNPEKKHLILSLDQYVSLFSELRRLGIDELSVSGGEPFVDERIDSILLSAIDAGFSTRIVTNGTLLHKNGNLSTLLKLAELRLSIDSVDSSIYSKARGCSPLMNLIALNNLSSLLQARDGRQTPHIGVSSLVTEDTLPGIDDFLSYMLATDVDSIIIKYDINDPSPILKEKYLLLKERVSHIADPRLELREPIAIERLKGTACFAPYLKLAISPYGDVFSCCLASQPLERNGYLLGSLHDQDFAGIWESSRQLRQDMIHKGVGCNNCPPTDYLLNRVVEGELDRLSKSREVD